MADNILQTIAEYTKERIAEAKRSVSPEEMRTRAMDAVQEQQEHQPCSRQNIDKHG